MSAKKPIRVFYSPLTGRFWATQSYRIAPNGDVTVTGEKWDVTNDVASAVVTNDLEFTPAEAKP
jgi:hypothetical protein